MAFSIPLDSSLRSKLGERRAYVGHRQDVRGPRGAHPPEHTNGHLLCANARHSSRPARILRTGGYGGVCTTEIWMVPLRPQQLLYPPLERTRYGSPHGVMQQPTG